MKEFVFQWPWALPLLSLAAPLVWLALRARKRRLAAAEKLGCQARRGAETREWLWVGAFAILSLALARPGYDPVRHAIEKSGRDVVFVLDVSQSMLAEDAYPSRLEAAKQGIIDCLEILDGEQAGLVIYAGSASISCPLTSDYEFARYMLSQIEPRSVEFGGSLLLSAVEKSVDQVFNPERRGFQDLILLTDGEDHGPGLELVARRIENSGVKLLVVGLGDSESGSRIPIVGDEGSTIPLKHKGEIVLTKLRDGALKELAGMLPDSEYIKAGTLPFHLGEIYRDFSEGEARIASGGDSGYVVYKEASFFLMPLAFILAAASLFNFGSRRVAAASIVLAVLAASEDAALASEEVASQEAFQLASELLENGHYSEAESAFAELAISMERGDVQPDQLAAVAFNQGLSQYKLAEDMGRSAPRDALGAARRAQNSFFAAARYRPGFQRAGARLDLVAAMVEELEVRVRDEEEREQERDKKIEALLERVKQLRDDQAALRSSVDDSDVERVPVRGRRLSQSAAAPVKVPDDAERKGLEFQARQAVLRATGVSIQNEMSTLDSEFSIAGALSVDTSGDSMRTVMERPLELIQQAIVSQEEAEELLPQWRYWISARARQSEAIDRLQEILDLFAANSEDEGEGDWDEEDWEEFMNTDPGEAVATSMPMQGEFRKDAMMQPLPTPNFSAEDVLMEEKNSQQFRQQQRAKANAGKVEKDW